MNQLKRSIGSIKSGSATETAPYTQAVEAVQQVVAAVRQCDAAVNATGAQVSMIAMIIDETFYLLHEGALYSGMGEEAVSAAFAASLAAASEMWSRIWVWPGDEVDGRILYQHYSDKEETVLGADFSLIFVDQTENGPVYRVIVVQAKRLTAAEPTKVNIWRKAFTPKKPETHNDGGTADQFDADAPGGVGETGGWEDVATERLERALAAGGPEKNDLDRAAENYQLSRLLNLRKQVRKTASAEFVYVMWPAKPKKGEVNTVLYEKLDAVAEYFNGEGKETAHQKENAGTSKKRYPVSFPLVKHLNFRDYLLDYKNIQAMSERQLLAILPAIREESTATILLNASGQTLSTKLTDELHIAEKPPYKPATGKNSLTPKVKR